MKLFTVSEANALLPQVRLVMARLQKLHAMLQAQRGAVRRAAQAGHEEGGGGILNGGNYVIALLEFSALSAQINDLGIQIKDYGRGLIDFPALREGRIVLLCWQLGEGDTLAWWHDMEAGFAGRQPL